jgi:negative regulator of sigma E activity
MSAEDRLEPVFGPDGQPDAATLAGLELDAFDAETTALIRARLDESPESRETLAALEAVRNRLHEQPPPRMPDAVADRISAALRAEQDARAAAQRTDTGPPVVAEESHEPQQPAGVANLEAARARRAHRTRRLGLAAAGVAVLAAGGIVYGVTSQNSTGGNPQQPNEAFGGQHSSSSGPSAHNVGPNQGANPPRKAALPTYTKADLRAALPTIVATSKVGVTVPDGAKSGPDVAACTGTLGQKSAPVAVQHAQFEGQNSYVFVFPTGTDRQAKVFVVTPTCTGSPLYQTSGQY